MLLASLALSGCYTTTPLAGRDPQVRSRVTVRLTDRGAAELTPAVGADVRALDATVEGTRGDTLELIVHAVELRAGGSAPRPGSYVRVARDAVASMEVRTLDRRRSWLLGGSMLAGVIVIGAAFGLTSVFESGSGGSGETPPQ